jgi:amino acid transporter
MKNHAPLPEPAGSDAPNANRRVTLPGALSLNLMNMIGVGPFITLPLVAAALGPGAWLGWLLGALLAVCDGLVWAELGAALPRAGGSYAFLKEIYKPKTSELSRETQPGRPDTSENREITEPGGSTVTSGTRWDAGRFLSFLYAWQLLFTAPLSIASGALGLAQYAAFLLPDLHRGLAFGFVTVRGTNLLAASVCVLVVVLLSRGLGAVVRTAGVLTAGVLLTLLAVIAVGITHLHKPLVAAQLAWPHGPGLLEALGAATLITTYDYWGYYNVCFLGGEVREPGRTIPRAVLASIALVATLYLLMNFAVLGAVPLGSLVTRGGQEEPMAAVLMRTVLPGSVGRSAAVGIAVLIMWTAFASVVSLLLGYSRAPYAAARDGNLFAPFAKLHPQRSFPQFALLTLGAIATVFCFFDLRSVIAALVAVRIVLQYGLQQIGVIVLRVRQPELPRPFRMWLYPLPPLLALGGFGFLLFFRAGAVRELLFAGALGLSGALLYVWRERQRAA